MPTMRIADSKKAKTRQHRCLALDLVQLAISAKSCAPASFPHGSRRVGLRGANVRVKERLDRTLAVRDGERYLAAEKIQSRWDGEGTQRKAGRQTGQRLE